MDRESVPQAVVDRRQYLAEPSRVAQDDVLIGRVHASGDRPQVQVADAGHARHRGHCRPHLFGIDPGRRPFEEDADCLPQQRPGARWNE